MIREVLNKSIIITDDITDEDRNDLFKICNKNEHQTSVTVILASLGGSTQAGYCIYEILKRFYKDITVKAYGVCMSAAIPIFMSGNKRITTKNTLFLIHPSVAHHPSLRADTKNLKLQLDHIEANALSYAKILKETTIPSKDIFSCYLSGNHIFVDGENALRYNLATELI